MRFIQLAVLFVGLIFSVVMLTALQPDDAFQCPITQHTSEQPEEDNIASWSDLWYRSDDGEIWADAWRRYAGGIKVGWRKPAGSELVVTGRRLDGDAPPLESEIPDGYAGNFQASGIIFPTPGCWEVTAQAEESTFTFVNIVYPKAYSPFEMTTSLACESIDGMAQYSTAIVMGVVEGSYAPLGETGPFIWQTIRVTRRLSGPLRRDVRFELLRDVELTSELQYGQEYLLFLWAQAGSHLRVFCPAALIDGDVIDVEIDWERSAIQDGQAVEPLLEELETALDNL